MSERARELADRFARGHERFCAFVETVPVEYWETVVGDGEERSVGIVCRHVALGYAFEQPYLAAMAAAKPLPPTSLAAVTQMNADHARRWQGISRDEVLEQLRIEGEKVTGWLAGLSDEQLQQEAVFVVDLPARTVAEWIEFPLIAHGEGHMADIRAALAAQPRV